MKNIDHVVVKYLSKDTTYAIQIIGAWGRGKTFYYKNVLEKIISSVSTFADATTKYRPVYISLFGIKTVDDIQIRIFNELLYRILPLPKKRFSKESRRKLLLSARLMKLILKGFLTNIGMKGIDQYEAEVKDIAKDVVDTKNIVICFDDLERKSEDLRIEDFIGYVNALVEEKTKVIIICNEDKIKDETYASFKEKTVGVTYEYNPNNEKIIENIITSTYTSSPVYLEFLKKNLSSFSISNGKEFL